MTTGIKGQNFSSSKVSENQNIDINRNELDRYKEKTKNQYLSVKFDRGSIV